MALEGGDLRENRIGTLMRIYFPSMFNRVQQELATREKDQKVMLELENEKAHEQLNAFEAYEVEETKATSR